ncbi:MAG: ketopantoate reductase family protein [Spirochaetia bacterium]
MPKFPDLRIAVIGAGSTGGVLAGLLKKKGYDVTLVTGKAESTGILLMQGITLKEGTVKERIPVPAVTHPSELNRSPDIVFLCVKGYDIAEAAESFSPIIQNGTCIVVFQPVIYEEALKNAVTDGKLVSGVIGWSAAKDKRFTYTKTSRGGFILGPMRNALMPVITAVGDILSETGENYVIDNRIESIKWGKLIIDSVLNAFGLILGCTFGEFLSEREIRLKAIEVMGQTADTVRSLGKEPAGFGTVRFGPVKIDRNTVENLDCHIMLRNYGAAHKNRISTDLQSLNRGDTIETAGILIFIIGQSEKAGISVPGLKKLYSVHQDIASGKMMPSLRNIHKI